jgi:WD40 repeat protein
MAEVHRHRRAIAATLLALVTLAFAPALAQDQGFHDATDLYDRPVLAIDPGKHTAAIWSQAVDEKAQYAVTGSADRTVRVWSVADGKLLRTIWIPVGPENVGAIFAVAISPDGSTIAAGGWTGLRLHWGRDPSRADARNQNSRLWAGPRHSFLASALQH